MYNSWADAVNFYFSVHLVYRRKVSYLSNGVRCYRDEHAMPLISVSPMAMIVDSGD